MAGRGDLSQVQGTRQSITWTDLAELLPVEHVLGSMKISTEYWASVGLRYQTWTRFRTPEEFLLWSWLCIHTISRINSFTVQPQPYRLCLFAKARDSGSKCPNIQLQYLPPTARVNIKLSDPTVYSRGVSAIIFFGNARPSLTAFNWQLEGIKIKIKANVDSWLINFFCYLL